MVSLTSLNVAIKSSRLAFDPSMLRETVICSCSPEASNRVKSNPSIASVTVLEPLVNVTPSIVKEASNSSFGTNSLSPLVISDNTPVAPLN